MIGQMIFLLFWLINKYDSNTFRNDEIFIYKKSLFIYIYIYIQGAYDRFQDFFRMGTFIDSTHMKL